MYKLPFVSRRMHEELVARLDRQIAELKADQKALMNRITAPVFGGIGLLEEIPKEIFETAPEAKKKETEVVDDVKLALRQTGGNPRKAADLLTRQNEVKFNTESKKALDILDEAYQSGRAAATGNA